MDVYCIDTSSYVYCQKSFGERLSRLVLYQAVWELLDSLAANGRLTGPHQVFKEITKNKDHVGIWAANHAGIFRPSGEHADIVLNILNEPGQRLVDPLGARGGEEADPWVIALAEAMNQSPPTLWDERTNVVVVSEELKPGGIQDIAVRRGLRHIDFAELLGIEGVTVAVTP